MKLRIFHETKYTYGSDVFFEPHILRFKPKSTVYYDLKSFNTVITPEPTGYSENLDVENNHHLACWFEGMHSELIIKTESNLELNSHNPFNFLIHPVEYTNMPFQYNEIDFTLLKPSLASEIDLSPMDKYIEKIKTDSENDTVKFITNLTRIIHNDFIVESRDTGNPFDPSITFRSKRGSCRDLAWMQIHFLRQSGIASRFVSGYYFFSTETSHFDLHAWAEIFLPGAGWIGFDPSHGIITGNTHIPLASSAFYENTMPVTGTNRGKSTGKLSTRLTIENIITN